MTDRLMFEVIPFAMNQLLVGILLALILIISFILQHYFSSKSGKLDNFIVSASILKV